MKKILLISELFAPPYDEGMKVTTLNLLRGISCHADCIGLGPCGGEKGLIRAVPVSKLMYSETLRREIKRYRPHYIFYIPEASATLNSFIRYRILRFMTNGAGTAMIVLRSTEYTGRKQKCIKLTNPGPIFVFSSYMSQVLKNMGIHTSILPLGVDTEKYVPVSFGRKLFLREKYHIPKDKYLILHVGHVRKNRNVQTFVHFANHPNIQVLLVGSTSTPQENDLKNELRRYGIRVIDHYVPETHELYQLSDSYIFPVVEKTGAIDFPLSVLEAMACNLPVITTPFGSLPENFSTTDSFRYYSTHEELKRELDTIRGVVPKTREIAERFSWKNIAKQLLEKSEVLQ